MPAFRVFPKTQMPVNEMVGFCRIDSRRHTNRSIESTKWTLIVCAFSVWTCVRHFLEGLYFPWRVTVHDWYSFRRPMLEKNMPQIKGISSAVNQINNTARTPQKLLNTARLDCFGQFILLGFRTVVTIKTINQHDQTKRKS